MAGGAAEAQGAFRGQRPRHRSKGHFKSHARGARSRPRNPLPLAFEAHLAEAGDDQRSGRTGVGDPALVVRPEPIP